MDVYSKLHLRHVGPTLINLERAERQKWYPLFAVNAGPIISKDRVSNCQRSDGQVLSSRHEELLEKS